MIVAMDGSIYPLDQPLYPFCEPLNWYHGHVLKSFSALPSDGVFVELIKRIAILAMIPFAYIQFGILWLVGRLASVGQVTPSGMHRRDSQYTIATKMLRTTFNSLTERLEKNLDILKNVRVFITLVDVENKIDHKFSFKATTVDEKAKLLNLINYSFRHLRAVAEPYLNKKFEFRYLLLEQYDDAIWRKSKESLNLPTTDTPATNVQSAYDEIIGYDTEMTSAYLNLILEEMGFTTKPSITLNEFMNL